MGKCQQTRFQNLHSYDTTVPLIYVFILSMHTCSESLSITSEFPPQGREDGGSISLYSPLDTQSLQKNNFVECRDLRSAGSP